MVKVAHMAADAASETNPISESQRNVLDEAKFAGSEEQISSTLEQAIEPTSPAVPEQQALEQLPGSLQPPDATNLCSAQEETNRVLGEIGDVLKNVNQALVSIQHSQIRVSLAVVHGTELYNVSVYEI